MRVCVRGECEGCEGVCEGECEGVCEGSVREM